MSLPYIIFNSTNEHFTIYNARDLVNHRGLRLMLCPEWGRGLLRDRRTTAHALGATLNGEAGNAGGGG
jgi:hypothetical protein